MDTRHNCAAEAANARSENKRAAIIFAVIALAAAAWLVSGLVFGIVGIAMPALALVPVAYLLLVLLTKG